MKKISFFLLLTIPLLPNSLYSMNESSENESSEMDAMDSYHFLMYAIKKNCLNEVEEITKKNKAHINQMTYDYPYTPLMIAALHGHTEILHMLIKNGASVNIRNNRNQCALAFAVYNRNALAVTMLVNAYADVNVDYDNNISILEWAIKCGVNDIAEILINAGANIFVQNAQNSTLLHVTQSAAIADLLIKKGANVNAQDTAGNTPLINRACYTGKDTVNNAAIALLLIKANANIYMRNNENKSALQYAINNQNETLMNLIIKHSNPTSKGSYIRIK